MALSLLERTRAAHEDVEHFETALIQLLLDEHRTHRANLTQAHHVNMMFDKILGRYSRLQEIYEDADGSRKDEITNMGLQGATLFNQFYDKLGEIKEYHRKYPDVPPEQPEAAAMLRDALSEEPSMPVQFSSAEHFGRYLDLDTFFQRFNNLKGLQPMEYWEYVEKAFQFTHDAFRDETYLQYLRDVKAYLLDFIKRTQPLYMGMNQFLSEAEQSFTQAWDDHSYVPIGRTANNSSSKDKVPQYLLPWESTDIASMQLPAEEGVAPSFYCVACKSKFAKETVFKAHIGSNKHAKQYEKYANNIREICLLESQIKKVWDEILPNCVQMTKENIQKKLARNVDEESVESEDELDLDDGAGEEPEVRLTKRFYPVGWDGNPIPFWLYRLHGLGIEYVCEICGNTSYWGRRAFEKHFSEWRHAHGMKCLGIENTKEFYEITKIQDALDLAKKLKATKGAEKSRVDAIEEFEDPDGNVLDKKTYELLAKQFGYE